MRILNVKLEWLQVCDRESLRIKNILVHHWDCGYDSMKVVERRQLWIQPNQLKKEHRKWLIWCIPTGKQWKRLVQMPKLKPAGVLCFRNRLKPLLHGRTEEHREAGTEQRHPEDKWTDVGRRGKEADCRKLEGWRDYIHAYGKGLGALKKKNPTSTSLI